VTKTNYHQAMKVKKQELYWKNIYNCY